MKCRERWCQVNQELGPLQFASYPPFPPSPPPPPPPPVSALGRRPRCTPTAPLVVVSLLAARRQLQTLPRIRPRTTNLCPLPRLLRHLQISWTPLTQKFPGLPSFPASTGCRLKATRLADQSLDGEVTLDYNAPSKDLRWGKGACKCLDHCSQGSL